MFVSNRPLKDAQKLTFNSLSQCLNANVNRLSNAMRCRYNFSQVGLFNTLALAVSTHARR